MTSGTPPKTQSVKQQPWARATTNTRLWPMGNEPMLLWFAYFACMA